MHTAEQQPFLASVVQFNERYNVVCAGEVEIALMCPFWSETEITRAKQIQEDWGLPRYLVPFYGDWHTVICLDLRDGSVRLLDDKRISVFQWPSVHSFVQSLKLKPETPADTSGVVEGESWLDI